jgi:hypothetical protein
MRTQFDIATVPTTSEDGAGFSFGLLLVLASAAAAALSIKAQGFYFGVGNNIFHIPIIDNWAGDPALAGDRFIGTLKYYVSGIWALFRLLPRHDHTQEVFLVSHFVARWATLLVSAGIAFGLGTRRLPALVLMVFWLGLTPILRGVSPVGEQDMFVDFFTHTELTLPLTLFSLLLASRKQFLWAFALTGIVFDINIFVAVWTGVALLFSVLRLYSTGDDGKRLLRQSAAGSAIAAALAAPVLYWTLHAMAGRQAILPFDYVGFLRQYYPNHFLIDVAAPSAVAGLAALIVATDALCGRLGRSGPIWRALFRGFVLVFVTGVFLPYLTHNSLLLNLHLLRVDGVISFLAILLAAIMAVRNLTGNGIQRLAGAAALGMLTMANPVGTIFAAVLALAFDREEETWRWRIGFSLSCLVPLAIGMVDYPRQTLAEAAIAVALILGGPLLAKWPIPASRVMVPGLVAVVALYLIRVFGQPAPEMYRWLPAVKEAAEWARAHTDPRSVFLEPVKIEPDFGLWAKRRIWFSWKSGAAVMWDPSYYWVWWPRFKEVRELDTLSSKLAYACAHHLDYVVTEQTGDNAQGAGIVFQNSHLLIARVPEECRDRQ